MIVEAVVVGAGSNGSTKIVEGVGGLSQDCGFLGVGLVSLGRNFSTGQVKINVGQDSLKWKKNANGLI